MDRRILSAKQVCAEAKKELNSVVLEVQTNCQHMNVGECDYLHSDYGSSFPPLRLCLDCGVTEEGWGIGYVVLVPKRVYKVSRDEIYQERIGKFYDDEAKCEFKGYRKSAA